MPLTGTELESLTRDIANSVNDLELQSIVHIVTGDMLYEEYVGPTLPFNRTIRELLIQLEKNGSLGRFLAEIIRRKPYRDDLAGLFGGIVPAAVATYATSGPVLSLQKAGKSLPDSTTIAAAPGLQRNVRPHLHMLEVRDWLEALQRMEKQVCRVEFGNNGLGTGFLVGPSAVLTNWHVISSALEKKAWDKIGCRFDYLLLPDGSVQEGVRILLVESGVAGFSRSSPAELTPDPDKPPPMHDELDYALLHLAEPVGDDRGWVEIPSSDTEQPAGGPIIIAQHPLTAPMKLAIDTAAIIGLVHEKRRLRYHTNTEAGSSGSPCFDMEWRLVALHHLGDPANGPPAYNQGIPAALIHADMVRQGLAHFLAPPKGDRSSV